MTKVIKSRVIANNANTVFVTPIDQNEFFDQNNIKVSEPLTKTTSESVVTLGLDASKVSGKAKVFDSSSAFADIRAAVNEGFPVYYKDSNVLYSVSAVYEQAVYFAYIDSQIHTLRIGQDGTRTTTVSKDVDIVKYGDMDFDGTSNKYLVCEYSGRYIPQATTVDLHGLTFEGLVFADSKYQVMRIVYHYAEGWSTPILTPLSEFRSKMVNYGEEYSLADLMKYDMVYLYMAGQIYSCISMNSSLAVFSAASPTDITTISYDGKDWTTKTVDVQEKLSNTDKEIQGAVSSSHTHSNKSILDGITSDKVGIWDGKQDRLTFDTTPTANSTNPVTSGGVKAALDEKQDKLTAGQGISLSGTTISNTYGLTRTRIDNLTDDRLIYISSFYSQSGASVTDMAWSFYLQYGSPYKISFNGSLSKTATAIDLYVSGMAGKAVDVTARPVRVICQKLRVALVTNTAGSVALAVYLDGATAGSAWTLFYGWLADPVNGTLYKTPQPFNKSDYGTFQDLTINLKSMYDSCASNAKVDAKQDKLTFDTTPTADSTNPVTSGGIKAYIDAAIAAALGK